MTYGSKVLLICTAAIAGLALLYAGIRQRKSTTLLSDLRNYMKENVAETRALHRTVRHQRGAINDIHRYLLPVSKGFSKHNT